jgi:Protein of unknown function (DUF2380)
MEDRVESLSRSLKVTLTVLKRPWAASSLALAMLITAGLACAEGERTAPILIAVVDFDYVDTSGEVRDQRVEHETRLQAFMRAIRDDLGRSGQYRVVPLVCTQAPCPTEGSAQLMKDARSSGARLLLYGGIHKESTLIQWMKVEAVEIENGQHLFSRLMTFRGDTDESWTRSERFLIQQLTEEMNLKGTKQPQQ